VQSAAAAVSQVRDDVEQRCRQRQLLLVVVIAIVVRKLRIHADDDRRS
jgi:hypothetical protein